MSRFWKVQESKISRNFMKKNFFIDCFFGDTNCFFFLCCAHPWNWLHHEFMFYFISHVSGINHQTIGTRGERSTIYDVKIKKLDDHKHLWHLRANRGAREMNTNCDRSENIFIWNSISWLCFWFYLWGIEQMNREGNDPRRKA